jgi:SAM-dependent methyltransferase
MSQIAIIPLLKRKMYKVRHKYLVFLDKRRGIDIREPEIIKDVHQDLARNFRYSTSGKRFLEQAVKRLPITSDDAILDFGCGKGGALVTFSKYPFRKLGGVELSSKLYTIAQNNMARLKITHVELFCCDAAEFTALDDYTYLYFFSPFSSAVMEPVMRNVIASLQSRPRKLTIIYNNPVCHDTILKTGVFVKTAEFPRKDYAPCFIYQYTQA